MSLSLTDRLELSDLVHRYAAWVDARRFDDAAGLFTATAELAVPAPPDRLGPSVRHRGPAGVAAALAVLDDVTRTLHAVVGEVYTPGPLPDTATGLITAVAHHWSAAGDGGFRDLIWYLHYTDGYRRTAAGWRIERRSLSIDAIETRPAKIVRPHR